MADLQILKKNSWAELAKTFPWAERAELAKKFSWAERAELTHFFLLSELSWAGIFCDNFFYCWVIQSQLSSASQFFKKRANFLKAELSWAVSPFEKPELSWASSARSAQQICSSASWHLNIRKINFQMTNNFWMDGAAFINQCPILPHQQFTYSWKAENAGTFWYHTHSRALEK